MTQSVLLCYVSSSNPSPFFSFSVLITLCTEQKQSKAKQSNLMQSKAVQFNSLFPCPYVCPFFYDVVADKEVVPLTDKVVAEVVAEREDMWLT